MNDKAIAVDLDGVIFEYRDWKGIHHFGKPVKNAKRSLEMLRKMGFKIVIYTTRTNPRFNEEVLPQLYAIVAAALEKEKIPFDEIEIYGKPIALYYIDDRGISFENWDQTLKQITVLEDARAKLFS